MKNKKGLNVQHIGNSVTRERALKECLHGDIVAGLQERADTVISSLNEALDGTANYMTVIKEELDCCKDINEAFVAWETTMDELEESAKRLLDDEQKAKRFFVRNRRSQHNPPAHRERAHTNKAKQEAARYEKQLLQVIEDQNARILKLEGQLNDIRTKRNIPTEAEVELNGEAAAGEIQSEQDGDDSTVNRLIIVERGNQTLKFPLTRNIMTIGRETENDINIRSRFISRFHARIVNDRHGCTIEDLDSCNGLSVNSRKVARKALHSGDRINLGRIQLKYIDLMDDSSGEGAA
jgi:pSer/pThr/pTyr-binding forkhead associated (FHA) protein